MIARRKPTPKRSAASKGSSTYDIADPKGPDPLLVITTSVPAKLVKEEIFAKHPRTEGVAMYSAAAKPRYFVSYFDTPAGGQTLRRYMHWNHTNSRGEADAMFSNLLDVMKRGGGRP